MVMAKKVVTPAITLGRNNLNIAEFKKFLDGQQGILSVVDAGKFNRCYERCLSEYPSPRIEVKVEQVLSNGLAFCIFYGRGAATAFEILHVPAHCLEEVMPIRIPAVSRLGNPISFSSGHAVHQ